jgi:hypothetical protein
MAGGSQERGPDGRLVSDRRGRAEGVTGELVELTTDEHRTRHLELHDAIDELLADYLLHHPGSLPSRIGVIELMSWSHEQTIDPCPYP